MRMFLCRACKLWHAGPAQKCEDCKTVTIASINRFLRRIHEKIKSGGELGGKPQGA